MNTAIHLQPGDLLVGAALVLAAAAASWAMRLQLQRQVLWASLRMVVQLLLVGYVLRLVFQQAHPGTTLVVVLVMIAAAAREVAVRPHQRLAGGGNYRIAGLVVALASLSTVVLALMTAVRPDPWFDARYAIPLMGIVLGSVLNAASLGLDSFFGWRAPGARCDRGPAGAGGPFPPGPGTAHPRRYPPGADPHHQPDVGCGIDHLARHHDRPDPGRHGPAGSGQVPDLVVAAADGRGRHGRRRQCAAGRPGAG